MPQNTNNIPTQPEANTKWSGLEVRSEEVQEIIGRPPHWLIRWGIVAFFGVLGLVMLSAAVIKYPEVVEAPIRLTAINAPQSLESRIGGKIVNLAVENNIIVEEGTVLAWLESTARHREVLLLSELTDQIRKQLMNGNGNSFEEIELSAFGNLGELQNTFQRFEQAWRDYRAYQPGSFYSHQRKILVQELDYSRQLLDQLHMQKEIQKTDYDLAEREFNMQKELAENDFISPVELARSERELASRQLPLQQTESAIINNYVSRAAKEKEIMELDRRMDEQQSVFIQSLNTMISAIDEWK